MPRPNPDARARLVAAAADMLRRRGLNATSVREVAKLAEAPLGSTYHYFPGGKQQMVEEAILLMGGKISHFLQKQFALGPRAGLQSFLGLWRETLLSHEFRLGCPVLAVAAEEPEPGEEGALMAAAQVFSQWEELLAEHWSSGREDRQGAENLASLAIAAVEGAIVMCRAKRSIEPFDRVAGQLTQMLDHYLTTS